MTAVRRFLLVLALLFWQGGFTFYTGVVVPIGTEFLGSAEQQGWITRRVTGWLNLAGLVAVMMLGWDLAVSSDPIRRRRAWRWLCWFLLLLGLVLLFWMHGRLDTFLDLAGERIRDRTAFRFWHRCYLWVSTFQWAVDLATIWFMLRAWQAEDGLHQSSNNG